MIGSIEIEQVCFKIDEDHIYCLPQHLNKEFEDLIPYFKEQLLVKELDNYKDVIWKLYGINVYETNLRIKLSLTFTRLMYHYKESYNWYYEYAVRYHYKIYYKETQIFENTIEMELSRGFTYKEKEIGKRYHKLFEMINERMTNELQKLIENI